MMMVGRMQGWDDNENPEGNPEGADYAQINQRLQRQAGLTSDNRMRDPVMIDRAER